MSHILVFNMNEAPASLDPKTSFSTVNTYINERPHITALHISGTHRFSDLLIKRLLESVLDNTQITELNITTPIRHNDSYPDLAQYIYTNKSLNKLSVHQQSDLTDDGDADMLFELLSTKTNWISLTIKIETLQCREFYFGPGDSPQIQCQYQSSVLCGLVEQNRNLRYLVVECFNIAIPESTIRKLAEVRSTQSHLKHFEMNFYWTTGAYWNAVNRSETCQDQILSNTIQNSTNNNKCIEIYMK